MSEKYLFENETYKIIGAAMEVHRQLGCGFTEKVYQDALEKEFLLQGIPNKREVHLHVTYKGEALNSDFIPDFVCYDCIIVELKAVQELDNLHRAQAINYTRVADLLLPGCDTRSAYYRIHPREVPLPWLHCANPYCRIRPFHPYPAPLSSCSLRPARDDLCDSLYRG